MRSPSMGAQYQGANVGGRVASAFLLTPRLRVSVSLLDARTVKWTNDAGISWNLTLTSDLSKVAVSSDSPYFAGGYTIANVQRDAKGVYAMSGR